MKKINHIWVIEENTSGEWKPLHSLFNYRWQARIERDMWAKNFPIHKFGIKKYVPA